MILTGTVRSGENNFSYWLSKLEPYYTAKTGTTSGFWRLPQTLNSETLTILRTEI